MKNSIPNNPIIIEENHISSEHIQKCIDAFKVILNNPSIKPELQIIAESEIKEVDYSLFGHLMLFSSEYQKKYKRKLFVKLELRQNQPKGDDENEEIDPERKSIIWKIRQHMVHSYYSMGMKHIFSLKADSDTFSLAATQKNGWFVLSRKFLPITYINKQSYITFFGELDKRIQQGKQNNWRVILNNLEQYLPNNDDQQALERDEQQSKSSNTSSKRKTRRKTTDNILYQGLRKYLFGKRNRYNYITILAQLAFYGSLLHTKLLSYHLFDELDQTVREKLSFPTEKENLKVSGISSDGDTKEKYRSAVQTIFFELWKKPPIYHLVFFTLTSSYAGRIRKKDINTAEYEKSVQYKLLKLWDFTKEFVYGLEEISKNIIQHSTEEEGVISGFVNEKDELEVKIFDHGKVNILETFKQDNHKRIKELENKTKSADKNAGIIDKLLLGIYKDDSELINAGKFKFNHFFKTQSRTILNQQAKRSTAHLGLLFFSKLIEKNKGRFEVASKEMCFSSERTIPKPFHGTYFRAKIPLNQNFELDSIINISQPKTEPIGSIDTLNALLDYKILNIDPNETLTGLEESNIILNIDLSFDPNDERPEQNLISFFNGKIAAFLELNGPTFFEKNKKLVFAFNFEKVNGLNGSQLLRLIGLFELLFPAKSLIVYNLPTVLFFELMQVNRALTGSNKSLPFWNKDTFLLSYSYKEIPQRENSLQNQRFYFTDILWGENREQFKFLSKQIRKNNFNAIDFILKDKTSKTNQDKEDNSDISALMPDNILFKNKTSLLPFDLLLKNDGGYTLFETNSNFLLNKRVNQQGSYSDGEPRHQSVIEKELDKLPGFRIDSSHYRLGSKIHLEDFFYAKRYFQNSFFANRFAFLITEYLLKSTNNQNERQFPDEKLKDLTLLGYGMYSELLLSLTEALLKEHYGKNAKVNHNIINDVKSMSVIKDINYMPPNRNVIIIVPIASTFSTSLKMEEHYLEYISAFNSQKLDRKGFLKEDYSPKEYKVDILHPHINLLLISDGLISEGPRPNEIEKKHGWVELDGGNKIVKVKSFFSNGKAELSQRFFISLPSKWYAQNKCPKCFPYYPECDSKTGKCFECGSLEKDEVCLIAEKALHYTDKTSVTPEELFGYPEAKSIEKPNVFTIKPESLIYGHSERNDDCFQFHIIDERFLQDHPTEIEKWLEDVKDSIFGIEKEVDDSSAKKSSNQPTTQEFIKPGDNVLIFAPEHHSNTVFVNIINQLVFGNSATVLHYDVWNNSLSNFLTFYKDFIESYDKFFFVDDTVITGGTFQKASFLLKYTKLEIEKGKPKFTGKEHITKSEPSPDYMFDGCIFLINRTTKYTKEMIVDLVKNKYFNFSFANLHLPNAKAYGTRCQQCADYERLKHLFYNSNLDRLKNHFYTRVLKLKKKPTTKNSYLIKRSPPYNKHQNLIKIEITHRLFDYFQNVENIRGFNAMGFLDWQDHFLKNSESPFKNVIVASTRKQLFPLSETTCALLKVLALHPFVIHQPIKDRVFYWTNQILNDLVELITKEESIQTSERFRDFKFLVRRAALLKSNFVISKRLLSFISEYIPKYLLQLNDSYYSLKQEIDSDKESWGSGALKEAENIKNDQLKSISLEIENIQQFSTYFAAQIKEMLYENEARSIIVEERIRPLLHIYELPHTKQILRRVLEENGLLINSFWEQVRKELTLNDIQINEHGFIKFKDEEKANGVLRKRNNVFSELKDFLIAAGEIRQSQIGYEYTNTDILDENIKDFLRINTFLAIDAGKEKNPGDGINGKSLSEKTDALCKTIEKFFISNFEENNDLRIGTFFLVKYREQVKEPLKSEGEYQQKMVNGANAHGDNQTGVLRDYLFPAYNLGYAEDEVKDCLGEEDNYIGRFIDGISNRIYKPPNENGTGLSFDATIDVIAKVTDENQRFVKWESEYADPNVDEIKIDFFKDIENVKNVLILRFSEIIIDEDNDSLKKESLGAMVIYSNKNIFSYQKNRYLLLLRKSINKFISKHHKSDEFRDWYEDMKIRGFYEVKLEKYNHNAKRYVELFNELVETNVNPEILFSISQLIISQIRIGETFLNFSPEKTLTIKSSPLAGLAEANINKLKKIFDGLKWVYSDEYESEHNICFEFPNLEELKTEIRFEYLVNIINELICNAIYSSSDKNIIKLKVCDDRLTVSSYGKSISCSKRELEDHIFSDYPNNKNFGIGLFVVNKITESTLKRRIEINIDTGSMWFEVVVPLTLKK